MLVIRSSRELKRCQEELRRLDEHLAELGAKYSDDADAYQMVAAGIEKIRSETAHAIEEYEQALAGKLPPVLHTREPDTGRLQIWRMLVLLRLAARLDQSDLARKLETQQSTVSRWESEGYDQYNLRQLQKIADALGCDVDVSFVRRLDRSSPAAGSRAGKSSHRRRA